MRHTVPWWLVLVAACAVDAAPPPAPGETGGSGGGGGDPRPEGGWGPSYTCAPGELATDAGVCVPAGIAPEDCGEYFTPDGERGCDPILPSAACPPGLMAIPGETVCREVAPCAAGQWGAIPVEADTVYVDGSFAGVSDGSADAPFTNVQDAVYAAPAGAIVAVAAGTYSGGVQVLGKKVRIWGVCPALVELTHAGEPTVDIDEDADGTELHDIAVTTADYHCVHVRQSDDVLLQRVWLHDATRLLVTGVGLDTGSVSVRASLLESYQVGVSSIGALTIEDSELRGGGGNTSRTGIIAARASNQPIAPIALRRSYLGQHFGIAVDGTGVDIQLRDLVIRDVVAMSGSVGAAIAITPGSASATTVYPSHLDAERVIIEQGGAGGIYLYGSSGVVSALVVRDNDPAMTDTHGDGVVSRVDAGDGGDELLEVRASLIEDVHGSGLYFEGSRGLVEGVLVRRVGTAPVDGRSGFGLVLFATELIDGTSVAADVTVRGSRFEALHEVGILAEGSALEVEGTLVRDVAPSDVGFGWGVVLEARTSPAVLAARGVMRTSLISGCSERGISVESSAFEVYDSRVEDVSATSHVAACAAAQPQTGAGTAAELVLVDSDLSACEGFGVLVVGSEAEVRGSVIGPIAAKLTADGPQFGDGIAVLSTPALRATLDVSDTWIHDSARAGVANFGADATVSGVFFECNPIDLDAESLSGLDAGFETGAPSTCRCGDDVVECRAQSTGLEPPASL